MDKEPAPAAEECLRAGAGSFFRMFWQVLFTFQNLILFSSFLIALLAYLDRNNKQK